VSAAVILVLSCLAALQGAILLIAARRSDQIASELAQHAGLEIEKQLVVGVPVPVLGAEARDAQLVVIGNRGLGGLTGLIAVAMAARAACPVAVIRCDTAAADPSGPVLVGVDRSPTSEAAVAFALGC